MKRPTAPRRAAVLSALTSLAVALAGCTSSPAPTPTDASSPASVTSSSTTTSTSSHASPPVVTADGVDPKAWTAVDASARRAGGTVALVAAVVSSSGQVRVVHRTGSTDLRPIASVAKLYVMVALLDALRDGKLTWADRISIRPEDISAGSGSLAGRDAAATVSVQEAARLMFQESDNTATSALVRVLGQPAMQAALRESGHSAPDRMTPFLTVREDLWLLYSAGAAAARAQWAKATPARRAQLIAPARTSPASFDGPAAWRSGLGYVASAEDLARAWAVIADRVRTLDSDVASSVMTVPSPGFTRPAGWSTVWFKSGALDNVRAGTWFAPGRSRSSNSQVVVVLAADGPAESGVASLGTSAAAELDRYATR
ncbi:serine hydrolase [Calidifontibacter indicus]|uniref:serine hydrolase n=1 Tax=Calidifontibacter indicus TaxID=419650 RepID=UPI003D74D2A8